MTDNAPDTTREIWTSASTMSSWLAQMDERERKRAEQFLFMAQLLPFGQEDAFTFLDLGAGTGAAARALLNVYPNAQAILVDFSPVMMDEGARAMAPYEGRYRYVELDLRTEDWPTDLPARVDAVISSQSIHHLPDERKRSLFRDILHHLAPGGWYVNFDPLRAPDPAVQETWQRTLQRMEPDASRLRPSKTDAEHIRHADHVRHMLDLDSQMAFLRDAGFEAVDVYWKVLDYAIYAGRRPLA